MRLPVQMATGTLLCFRRASIGLVVSRWARVQSGPAAVVTTESSLLDFKGHVLFDKYVEVEIVDLSEFIRSLKSRGDLRGLLADC